MTTESRFNRVRENGHWHYCDDLEADFVFIALSVCPIWCVDDFIDGLQDLSISADTAELLLGIRHDAFQAFKEKDFGLMDAHLGKLDMACRVAGMLPAAKAGSKFIKGRKPGSSGPIRKAIARLLAKTPTMKNAELWRALKDRPPRGWKVCENRVGHYIEGPEAGDNMGYERFCNVSAEERKKLNQKITG